MLIQLRSEPLPPLCASIELTYLGRGASSIAIHKGNTEGPGATLGTGNNDANNLLYGNSGVASTLVAGSGVDTLRFNATLFSSFSAAMADASQVGANTVFTIDANDTVTLDNVNKTSLTANNFHFV